jgi:hypothetical protein
MHVEVAPLLESHSHTATGRKLGPLDRLHTQDINLAFVHSAALGHCVIRISYASPISVIVCMHAPFPSRNTARVVGKDSSRRSDTIVE